MLSSACGKAYPTRHEHAQHMPVREDGAPHCPGCENLNDRHRGEDDGRSLAARRFAPRSQALVEQPALRGLAKLGVGEMEVRGLPKA